MTTAILSLLAALVPFVIWLWKRKAHLNETPVEKQRKWMREVEREIVEDDGRSASARVNAALADLRMRKDSRDPGGP